LDNFINVYDSKVDYDFWDQIFLLNIFKIRGGGSSGCIIPLFPYDDFYPRRNHDIYPEIELKKYDGWFIYFFPYLAFDDTGYQRDENDYVFAKENKIFSRNYSGGHKID